MRCLYTFASHDQQLPETRHSLLFCKKPYKYYDRRYLYVWDTIMHQSLFIVYIKNSFVALSTKLKYPNPLIWLK